jgi:predicted DNA-binding protein with PD1-like motif
MRGRSVRSRRLHDADGLRTFAVVFDTGDEAKDGLTSFAAAHRISAASLTAIGAFREAVLAYFDPVGWSTSTFPVDGQVEVLSLLGDIALDGDEAEVHAHVVVGHPDGRTEGRHLETGLVWPTLEVIVAETPTTCGSGSIRRPGWRSSAVATTPTCRDHPGCCTRTSASAMASDGARPSCRAV